MFCKGIAFDETLSDEAWLDNLKKNWKSLVDSGQAQMIFYYAERTGNKEIENAIAYVRDTRREVALLNIQKYEEKLNLVLNYKRENIVAIYYYVKEVYPKSKEIIETFRKEAEDLSPTVQTTILAMQWSRWTTTNLAQIILNYATERKDENIISAINSIKNYTDPKIVLTPIELNSFRNKMNKLIDYKKQNTAAILDLTEKKYDKETKDIMSEWLKFEELENQWRYFVETGQIQTIVNYAMVNNYMELGEAINIVINIVAAKTEVGNITAEDTQKLRDNLNKIILYKENNLDDICAWIKDFHKNIPESDLSRIINLLKLDNALNFSY